MSRKLEAATFFLALSFLTFAALAAPSSSNAQAGEERTISGTVTSAATGNPLPGVNVLLQDTRVGTSTDAEGRYTLDVSADRAAGDDVVLRLSFVGYRTETVAVEGRSEVNVSLERGAAELSEVVVVGYGTQERNDLTGAISSIDTDDFGEVPAGNFDQLLRGKAAGVFATSTTGAPASASSIRIRGANSIGASNEPLYVVDGVIGVQPFTLNPSDVESVDILKDASATAIYGARGANGVILVTTKQGRAGEPRVTASVERGWQDARTSYELMTGPERARQANAYNRYLGQPNLFANPDNVPTTDWRDMMLRTAPITEANLSVGGGREDTQYYLSGSYIDHEGVLMGSGFERLQARLNVDTELSAAVELGANLNLSRMNRLNPQTSYWEAIAFLPFMPIYDDDGSYSTERNPFSARIENNPAAEQEITSENLDTRLTGNLDASWEIIDGLTFNSQFGTDLRFSKDNRYYPSILPYRIVNDLGGAGNVGTFQQTIWQTDNTLGYDRTFGSHDLDAVAGVTYQTSEQENTYSGAAGFTSDGTGFNELSLGDPDRNEVNTGYLDWAILSFLGRVNYSYDNRYLLTVSGRRDGSSRLGANNKWAFFPSAAFGWRVSEEPFLGEQDLFSNLKLRLSYGRTGTQAVDIYGSLPSIFGTETIVGGQTVTAVRQGALRNSDLKWETTQEWNAGLDAGLFGGRLEAEANYYYKRTSDLLLDVEIPQQTGNNTFLSNVGEVQNQGVELQVRSRNIATPDVRWTTTFNISGNRNKVLDLGDDDSRVVHTFNAAGAGWKTAELFEGEPIGTYVGAVYEGVWQSREQIDEVGTMPRAQPGDPRYADVNGNGSFDGEEDFKIIGNPNPDFFGGLQNTLGYKGLSLRAVFQFSYGNDIMNLANNDFLLGNVFTNNSRRLMEEAWSEDNSDGTLPAAGSFEARRGVTSTLFVEDGSFLRLQTLTLGYELPMDRLGLSGFRQTKLYVTGENLWLLTNYSGPDPEVNLFGGSSVLRGYDRAQYPRARAVTLGLKLGF